MSPLLPEHDRERGCTAHHSPQYLLVSSLLISQQEQQRHRLLWVPSKTSPSLGPSPLGLLFGSAVSPWSSSSARHFVQRVLAALALVEIVVGLLGASAAFGILIYQSLIDGPHQVLFISFLRLAFLLFVGVVTFRAFGQQAEGFGRLSRASLCRVAILAQLLWFASELLLGSALVTFYPIVKGSRADLQALSEASGLAYRGSSAVYLLAMTGCLGFLSHIGRRRSSGASTGGHYQSGPPLAAVVPSGCCGFGRVPACRVPSSGSSTGCSGSSSSPAGSEADSFSSSSSALFYPDAGLSPTGPLGAGGCTGTNAAVSAGHAICSIVLVEHEVSGSPDGRGLFVHKQGLRPIRTRPDDAARPYVPLLKPIISNSFSCDPSAAASLRGALGIVASGSSFSTSGGGSGSVISSVQASGGSFQFATSASAPLPPHRYAL